MGRTVFKTVSVSEGERIHEVDILRGFALFGVLLVNTQMFNDTLMSFSGNPSTYGSPAEQITAWMIQIFATGKFYSLFSFLFGLGFYLFMDRLSRKGIDPVPVFKRRLFFLYLLGLVHMVFFWYGDILTAYALTGCLLLLFRNKSPGQILKWSLGLLTASTILLAWFMALQAYNLEQMTVAQELLYQQGIQKTVALYREGGLMETVAFRIRREIPIVYISFLFWIPKVLALFLAGLYAGKTGVFQNLTGNRPIIHRVFRTSAISGWSMTGLYVLLDMGWLTLPRFPAILAAELLREITTILLCLFYICGILLLCQNRKWHNRLQTLGAMGRLALTHYLTQSLVLSLILYGHGFGLMHRISIVHGVGITVILFGVQLLISRPLLNRYRQGPMEALWRLGTYSGGSSSGKTGSF